MAEIKIEKKKPVWPWILILGILALLVYFMAFRDRDEPKQPTQTESASLMEVKENNATVAAFVQFIEVQSKGMDVNHEYTNNALLKMTDATRAMAQEIQYDVGTDLDKVKQEAQAITEDKYATSHADSIRNATGILATTLQNMQQAKYPELAQEVSALRNASDAIKPGVLTLEQKDQIKSYFDKGADVLKKMN